jgi:acyl-CoA thioesterase
MHALATLVRQTSRYFQHLGMEIVDLEAGRCLIRLPIRDHLRNSSGGVHGGAMASLIDSAGGLAARALTHPATVATVEFNVNFLAPVREGTVVAEGRVIHRGRRTAVAEVTVRDGEERPVARGLVTLMILSRDGGAGSDRGSRHDAPPD